MIEQGSIQLYFRQLCIVLLTFEVISTVEVSGEGSPIDPYITGEGPSIEHSTQLYPRSPEVQTHDRFIKH